MQEEWVEHFPGLLAEAGGIGASAGEVIFSEGDPGDVMYAVREGAVELRVGGSVVETVGRGGLFGEMALVDDGPRSAAAVAATASEVVPIDRDRFVQLVEEAPGFALTIMTVMAERLRRANE